MIISKVVKGQIHHQYRDPQGWLGLFAVCWLLNVPAICWCISGTDLLRQCNMLPHWERDRTCRLTSCSHNIQMLGQPIPVLTLYCQGPDRPAAGVPIVKSLAGLDLDKRSTVKVGIKPRSATLVVDALTLGQWGSELAVEWRRRGGRSSYCM